MLKHGVPFEEAVSVFAGAMALTFSDSDNSETEDRSRTYGISSKGRLRPWKIFTLCIGIFLLIWGSFYYAAPDWDIPISLIMAFFAYLSAGWANCIKTKRGLITSRLPRTLGLSGMASSLISSSISPICYFVLPRR